MDFSGRGFILQEDFLDSVVLQRLQTAKTFTKEDVEEFIRQNNLFPSGSSGLTYDKFKRIFFPQLFLINESEESEDERRAKESKQILTSE